MNKIQELVEKLIQENPIMIFSKSHCPYSKKAKQTIGDLHKNYKAIELDIESDGAAIQNYLLEKTNQRTVPNIFINGEHIGGCDDLLAAKDSGTLAPKIANL